MQQLLSAILVPAALFGAAAPSLHAQISDPGYAFVEASENLRDWAEADLGGDDTPISLSRPEVIDNPVPTHAARFYRLRKQLTDRHLLFRRGWSD